jgi:heme/copper-type cytochrome/quinol oxidase subunit 3
VAQLATEVLDPSEESSLKSRRGGFGIFLAAQAVIPIVLISVRFLLATESVGPVNQVLGILSALLVLFAAYLGLQARQAAARGDVGAYTGQFTWAAVSAAVGVAVMVIQWITLFAAAPVGTRYSEVFFVFSGFWLLNVLIVVLLLCAARARGLRVPYGPENYWDAEAATLFTSYVALVGVVTYLFLYLI